MAKKWILIIMFFSHRENRKYMKSSLYLQWQSSHQNSLSPDRTL